LPLGKRATLFAKAGASSWRADVTTEDQTGRSTRSESGIDPTYGAGFQVRVTARTELHLEWERYANIVGADIDLVSLGLLIRIGRRGQ
jgi:hypothetical protein